MALICIFLMISDVEHHVPVGHLQVFFGKITFVVLPILNCFFFFLYFCCSVVGVVYIF